MSVLHLNKGKVRSFNDKAGYGFILCDEGRVVFAHFSQIMEPTDKRRTLEFNEDVVFDLYETDKGYEARNILRKRY